MRVRICLSVLILLLFGARSQAQTEYFPHGVFGDNPRVDHTISDMYSSSLRALDEPSFLALSKTQKNQSYRFLYLRAFHYPLAIRIDFEADGTSRITTKTMTGIDSDPDHHPLVQSETSPLTKQQTSRFSEEIERQKFWQLAAMDNSRRGLDGAEWIIEGAKDGNYHVVDRWSPENGPVRAISLFMLQELAKVKIPPNEMY